MKVTSVELHPADSSDVVVLSYRDPKRLNPYNVTAILGLDADEIVPKFYGVSESSNDKFYTLSLENRVIVIRIELNPRYDQDETPSSLRDNIYKLISSRTGLLQIQFKDGIDTKAAISGFITKIEAPLFSKKSEVQITVDCEDPELKALNPSVIDITGFDPAATVVTDSISTAPHGFSFEMEFTGAMESFIIGDAFIATTWKFEVTPGTGFLVGDILHLSSNQNDKYLFVDRGGVVIHLADAIIPGSMWPILFPGVNNFVCLNPESLEWLNISHYPTYLGV